MVAVAGRTGARLWRLDAAARGIVAWVSLPTLLLIVVAVLTVTPVATALVAGFRDAPPGRPGAITLGVDPAHRSR